MTSLRPMIVVLPRPRRPWRAVAVLTVFVTLAHLLVMGALPRGKHDDALPLAHRFSTRTIVIAPPAATGGGSPGTAAAPATQPAQAGPAPNARLRPHPRQAAPARPKSPPPVPVPAPEHVETPAPPTSEPEPPAASPPPDSAPPAAEATPSSPSMGQDALLREPDSTASDSGPPGGGGAGTGQGAGTGAGAGAGVPGATEALKVPPSVKLDFTVTGQQGVQPMSGVFGELIWLQDGSQYNARLALRVLFRTIRSRTSVGRVGPGGLEPERFSDTRRSEVATHFVRESGQIVFSSTTTPAPLQPGAQDELSVILQLSALLAGDPARHAPGSSFSVQTAGTRDAEVWSFSVDGDEAQATPAGEFQARKLTRLPRKPFDRKIELWLAPELGWLPVRIRQTEPNGDWADLQLRSTGTP
ncbi:Uncharacterised protein [Xylophilus ampelinus]|nr:DUF3108 domain-containing protein [Variovorax sp.]VTY32584.1 Uncharacterised protein [Xylophilus ampelinus]